MDSTELFDADIHSCTLLFQESIIKKWGRALEQVEDISTEFYDVFQDIDALSEITREIGILGMRNYYEKTTNLFLKELIRLMVDYTNISTKEIVFAIYLIVPKLLNPKFEGIAFLKALLYYEAMLLLVTGIHPEIIKYRLNGIIYR